MNTLSKVGKFLFNFITHLFGIAAILLFFYPIASWYYKARPLFGIDFFNTVSLVTELSKNIVFPPQAWLSSWSNGWPYISQYPVLHFYAILPFTYVLSVVESTLLWMIIASALNFIGAYFLFSKISRSKLLAVVLGIGNMYSAGVYGALLWGGGLPSYATQAFYPWVLYFIVCFIQMGSRGFFWLGVLTAGLSVWGHPQVMMMYIVPSACWLLLTGSSAFYTFRNFKKKIGYVFLFCILTFLIGLPLVYPTMGKALTRLLVVGERDSALSTMQINNGSQQEVAAFHRQQPWRMYIDTSPILYVGLGITLLGALFGFLIKPRLSFFRKVFPYLTLAGIYVAYITLYAYDISIYHGGWYRLFWSVPVWLGALSCSLWNEVGEGLRISFLKKITPVLLPLLSIGAALTIYYMGMSLPFLTPVNIKSGPYWALVDAFQSQKVLPVPQPLHLVLPTQKLEDFIGRTSSEGRSAFSSAYPPGIGIYPLDEKLKTALTPSFMKQSQSQNYRIYSGDATFNISWPVISTIANARGYLDAPITNDERGYLFWLDAAVNVDPTRGGSSLVTAFGYPEDVVVNHAKYLIDWNAIRYFQGGGGSSYSSPINDLVNNPQFITKSEDVDISPDHPIPILHQDLKYMELKEELTSPIVVGSKASVVGIVASESGYEAVVRSMASTNLNSQVLIPIKLGKFLDKVSDNDLKILDLLILYDYDYANNSGFKRVSEYVKKGGRVFIDSGVETKQVDNRKEPTPEIFPFETLVREGLGSKWKLESADTTIFNDVDVKKFSPPLFDETEWKIAYPPDEHPRNNVEIWLTNQSKPVLTKSTLGQGKVLWSGLNLFYHVTRFNNLDEGVLLKNILTRLIDTEPKPMVQITVERKTPRVVKVFSQGAKGILFKEELYPGWQASIKSIRSTSSGQNAKIYKVGPTNPGFMYVQIPESLKDGQTTVTFTYQGSLTIWILMIGSSIVCLFLLDAAILKGIVLGKFTQRTYIWLKGKTSRWWEKDEDNQ